MSEDTAMHALRIALAAPAPTIKIEFQGGEPLLNFPRIQQIVEAARRDAPDGKKLEFVIASNSGASDRRSTGFLSIQLDPPVNVP